MCYRFELCRRGVTVALAAALAAWLAACQPMPRPFAPHGAKGANPLLQLSDRAGVVVLDVDGAPLRTAEKLSSGMERALLDHAIPASRTGGNRRSRFLQGRAEIRDLGQRRGRGRIAIELVWELVDSAGNDIGRHTVTARARQDRWVAGDAALIKRLIDASAADVAAFLQDPAPRRMARVAEMRPLYVAPVTGAPGDGGRALQQAMKRALLRVRLKLAPEPGGDSLALAGSVSLGAPINRRQVVEIVWSVRRADGSEVGNLKQRNAVEAGSLDGTWGKLASIVAESAADGLVELLRQRPGDSVGAAAEDRR